MKESLFLFGVIAGCTGGTLFLRWLRRRAERRWHQALADLAARDGLRVVYGPNGAPMLMPRASRNPTTPQPKES